MSDRVYNVMFLCPGRTKSMTSPRTCISSSARSITLSTTTTCRPAPNMPSTGRASPTFYPKSPMEHVSDEQQVNIDAALAQLI